MTFDILKKVLLQIWLLKYQYHTKITFIGILNIAL